MNDDLRLSKVHILIQQERYGEAEKILADLLRTDATNIHFLSLLSEVQFQQDRYDEANRIIDSAIGLSPDTANLYFTKSRIALAQSDWKESERWINQAIHTDPDNASYFALSAHIKLARKKFKEALETADHALELDAENISALNARSTALNKLNQSEESFATIEGALREDPNNAYTHANYGWGLLEKGDHKKALTHFQESLTNDPNYEFAQAGMLEALKATNPVYRLFLKYAFFMENLTSKYQWGVIIGFYVVFRLIKTIARRNEALQPFLVPIIIALALIAFSTWVIVPISNLFLRFNKYGQLLLDKEEKMSSNFVAVSFGLCILSVALYFLTSDLRMLTVAAFGFAMMLPLGTMFSPSKNKKALTAYTIALGAVGLIGIFIAFTTGKLFNLMSIIFLFGFIAYQWIANFVLIREDN